MGFEKQDSKGGGRYVGGFLQLFDWNGKSRKKLFSNKSDLPGIFCLTLISSDYVDNEHFIKPG